MTYINEKGDVLYTEDDLELARGTAYARGWEHGAQNNKIGFVRRLRGLERTLIELEHSVPWGKKAHIVAVRAHEALYLQFEEIREDEESE